jgi:tetratricopeptide (TPR) repeat protein
MSKKKRNVKESKKKGKKKGIEGTDAWNIADWDYSQLIATDMMPLLSAPLAGQERIDYLNEIIEGCPEYYPALIELGYRYIREDKNEDGKAFIDKGLQSIKTHFSKENLIDAYYSICEYFEKYFRFEMAIEYYNQLMEIESDKAKVYDSVSYCHYYLGDIKKAFEIQQKALELNDSNAKFYCNMGWIEMIRGNLDTAKTMLEKSLELDQEDEVTVNNYKACKLMRKNKLKNWEAFLLSEIDYDHLEKLEDEDDFEEYDRRIRIYNSNKIEAFKSDLARNSKYTPTEIFDILFSLNYIFDLISESHESDYFHYDDILSVEVSFKSIMHKFILKTKDIDDEIFNGVYTAILEFYKYLEKQKVVSGYKSLKKEMLKLKPELIEKMLRYNEIRHNDEYSDEEKDDIREELFEDDVFLPLF